MLPLRHPLALLTALAVALAAPCLAVDVETYTLPNGLTVTLHEDHTLPQVVINTWFAVGSKDEPEGRSGFAHLFEHLMFMGTERVPDSSYDTTMERGGGSNNASTTNDRTNYYSWGPSSLLPTLMWLDADRLDALGRAMTQEKLDLQREVVRNERRENYENTPYNKAYLIIPQAMYPKGHPYHYSTIGNHEDLEAATLGDVREFFDTYYVPGNASLVVAGDFERDAVKKVIANTFGAVPARPLPEHRTAEPVGLEREVRRMALDRVESPKLYLVWHSPPAYADGDAEMDVVADILGGGPSSRLYRRLVIEKRLAREVEAFQWSKQLVSEFHVTVTAAIGGDLEKIKRIVLEEVERLRESEPSDAELARVKAATEVSFLRQVENLLQRADMLNGYRHYFGDPDGFDRDLARYSSVTGENVTRWAAAVLGEGRLDLRILPEGAASDGADLDRRPDDFPAKEFRPEVPSTVTLSNGIPVHYLSRPGSGLFSGALIADGGERAVSAERAGLASLAATMLTAGAGGRGAAEFADAVATLGGSIDAFASWHDLTVTVSGITSKLDPTLDLFADAVLRPNLGDEDFKREHSLALDEIRSRAESPAQVAFDVGRALLFGTGDPRGWPSVGYLETVERITLAGLKGGLASLLNPASARFVFVGDIDPDRLVAGLEARFGEWSATVDSPGSLPPPITEPSPGRLVIVDRPDAPQTFILLVRPISVPDSGTERAERASLNTVFGGTFLSRINANLREEHGYTYGARSTLLQSGNQFRLIAYASVQTEVTAPALTEFKNEFDGLAGGDVTADEFEKAVSTLRYDLTTSGETTSSLAATLQSIVSDGRPLDAVRADLQHLQDIDLQRVNSAARSGLYDWDSLLVVMVGDAGQVLPQIADAGFPEPRLVDIRGERVEAR
jgi:predicted Zn-dependent peptidase